MAKKGKGRSMRGYFRGNVNEHLDINALATKTLVGTPFDDVVSERTLVSSLVATWTLKGSTATAQSGPFRVGVAHSDYTDAQIEEWIETTQSWDVSDKLASKEISQRLIRTVGMLHSAATIVETSVLNEGKPIKTKLNWMLNEDQTLKMWAYNDGFGNSPAEVAVLQLNGHANLWQK